MNALVMSTAHALRETTENKNGEFDKMRERAVADQCSHFNNLWKTQKIAWPQVEDSRHVDEAVDDFLESQRSDLLSKCSYHLLTPVVCS